MRPGLTAITAAAKNNTDIISFRVIVLSSVLGRLSRKDDARLENPSSHTIGGASSDFLSEKRRYISSSLSAFLRHKILFDDFFGFT